MNRHATLSLATLAALAAILAVPAHAGTSASYSSAPESVNAGGGTASSASYLTRFTIGEAIAPLQATSTGHRLQAGFWAGASSPKYQLTVLRVGT